MFRSRLLLSFTFFVLAHVASYGAPSKVSVDENGVLVIDGKKTFVFSVSLPPKPDGKTPEGGDGLAELKADGLNFTRIRPVNHTQDSKVWNEESVRQIGPWLDAAAEHGLHCWVTLGSIPAIKEGDTKREKLLRLAIELYRNHPALGAWKAFDEAAWVKKPASQLVNAYRIFKEMDPNHPVIVIQAPEHHALPLEDYVPAGDIMGVDIFPVEYPPGSHGDFTNKEISVVADCTQWISKIANGKPVWMTLQIAWAGTATPGKTVRMPTFSQTRYMAYAAIVNGARGINFQGGERVLALNERDAKLGWNWTHWRKVMKAVAAELGENSPLQPALVAPDSKLPIKLGGAKDIEFCVREVGNEIFIFAAKREGATVKVKFSGLPPMEPIGNLMFEEPRRVQIKGGAFEDWFAPNEVHVYRLKQRT
jgi:hypothetical protein